MSRRVVIGILIFLILGVLSGTVALIIARFRTPGTEVVQNPQTSTLPDATTGGQQVVDPTGDTDADGLTNADEKIWGTNPNAQDTDNDGFKDGEEVAANHNPTIPSPNDKLPAGFVPGQNIAPLEGSAPSQTSFESFFADNVDLTGGKTNLTQEYARTVPDKDKSPVTFAQFISAQPITTSLPRVNDAAISTQADSPLALSQYLETAGNIDAITDITRLRIATKDFYDNRNVYGFTTLAEAVAVFESQLVLQQPPQEALQYHKLLIGYCELLAATFRQVTVYPQDQVKAMVGLRQLDTIDKQYYPLIIKERSRLADLLAS